MADSAERLAARIAALERALEALGGEISDLRAVVVGERGSTVAAQPRRHVPATPPSAGARPEVVDALPDFAAQLRARATRTQNSAAGSRPSPARGGAGIPDFETLVGRYGMLGLATLLALAAVGTFLSWAISHGLLGPTARVVLGSVVAAALAAWGLRLRRRERSFGDSVLGLSLAIAHVCAWAAGPSLHLVPAAVALAVSATVSIALAAFAFVENDEPLWCVGFGGAAIAPFVTSTGHGTAPMLAGYATVVLVAGGSALGSRRWSVGARVFALSAVAFTLALLAMPRAQHGALFALALPLVVAGAGVLPFTQGPALRSRLRTMGALAAFASAWLSQGWGVDAALTAIAIAVAALVWLALEDRADVEGPGSLLDGWDVSSDDAAEWVDGAVIPFAFLVALSSTLARKPDAVAAVMGVSTLVHLGVAARRDESTGRDALAAVAWASAVWSALLVTRYSEHAAAAAVAWVSVLATLVGRALSSRTWRWAPFLSLGVASLWGVVLVSSHPRYESLPFATAASAAALAVALAWVASMRLSESSKAWPGLAAFIFVWVHEELAYAVSPATSTLLLVTWYAVSSVVAVAAGRLRSSARLRHLGLGLALIASAIAVHAGFQLDSVAARIAACAVASGFLLGIAWWYRRPNDEAPSRAPSV
jgi:Predicted membrane protein (DUF2339)